jgi:hypothetical protein
MATGMKTMLGGWEDVQRLLAERALRAGSATPSASVSRQRCVAVAPKEDSGHAAARRFRLRETRVGGVSVPLLPLPAAQPLAPRHATRPQALTRPIRRPSGDGGAQGAARLAQLALDETCELRDVDFVFLTQQPAPPSPAPYSAARPRREGTSIEHALYVIPAPTRRRADRPPSFVQRVVQALVRALLAWLP